MENLFSIKRSTQGIRMYPTKDSKQRFYGRDTNYFISDNIKIEYPEYTISGVYCYAILDMYGETLESGYCNGTVGIGNLSKRAYYLVVSGTVDSLGSVMVLNASKEEVGDNPPYTEPSDGGSSGGTTIVKVVSVSSALAKNFVYDKSSNSYTVSSFEPNVSDYEEFADQFTLYIQNADHIKANSTLNLFGNSYRFKHIDGSDLVTNLESVPSVLPILCSKDNNSAKMLYSYLSTSQEGFGLEDIFLDIEDNEPFSN